MTAETGVPALTLPVGHATRVAAARASLGDDAAFDRAWHEGVAMSLEEAMAYALSHT